LSKSETNFWRQIKKNTPKIHWTRIESVASLGIPDLNGFSIDNSERGSEFWVELKCTRMKKIKLTPYQISWLTKRSEIGGKAFILAKALGSGAVYLYLGSDARRLQAVGLDLPAIDIFPRPVDWETLEHVLINYPFSIFH
jgi:hypothetical protein